MRLRRAALAALAALVTVLVIAHLPPVSGWLVRSVIDRIEGPLGLDIETSGVNAWPLGLSATLRDVRIRAITDAAPFLEADAVTIDLPFVAIRDRSRIGDITLTRPRIDLDGLTRWLDSRPTSPTPSQAVPRIDRLTITDATLRSEGEGLAFTVPALSLTLASTLTTPLGGAVSAADATLRIGDVTFDAVAIDGVLRYDGAVEIERARVTSRATALDVAGRIGMREGDRAMALTVAGTVAPLAMVLEPYMSHPRLDGALQVDGQVGGTFSQPRLVATVRSEAITIDGQRSGPLETRLTLTRERLDIGDTAWSDLFGGRAAVAGRVTFDQIRDADLDIRVSGVATAPILAIIDPEWPSIRSRATGTLRITGPLAPGQRAVVTSSMTFARADASPLSAEGRAAVTLDATRWRADLRDAHVGGVALSASLGGRRTASVAAPFAESSLGGTLDAAAPRLGAAIELLQALDVFDADLSPYELGGAVSATATLSGTVGAPAAHTVAEMPLLTAREGLTGTARATATVERERFTLHDGQAGLGETRTVMRGVVDVRRRSLAFDLDVDARSTDGAIRLFDLPRHLAPAGAFTSKVRITGSPDRPRLDATFASDAFTLAGQAPAAATGTVSWEGDVVSCRPCRLTRGRSTVDLTGSIDVVRERVEARGAASGWAIGPVTWPQVAAAGAEPTLYPLRGDLSGRFDVRGELGTLTGTVRVDLLHSWWGTTQPGDLTAEITLADGRASTTFWSPTLAIKGHAVIDQAAPHAFEASADVSGADLASIVQRLALDGRGTTGRLEGRLTASGRLREADSIRGSASVAAFDGTWRDLPLRLARPSSVDWSSREVVTRTVGLSLNGVNVDIDGALTSGGAASAVTARLSGRAEQVAGILAVLDVDAPDMQGAIDARVVVSGSPKAPAIDGTVTVTDGELRWPDVPAVSGIAADIGIADGVVTIRSLDARAQDASVSAHGGAPLSMFAQFLPDAVARRLPRARLDAAAIEATLTNLTHATASAFLGERVPDLWRGGVDATASLTASRLAAAAVDGTLTVTRATLSAGDLSVTQAAPAVARIDAGTVTLPPWRLEGSGTNLTVAGAANLADSAYPFTLSLDGTLDLRLLGTILPGRVNGSMQSAIAVRGSATDLDVTGRVAVRDGNWIARDLGLAVTALNGPLVLERDRITVDGVTARVNGGNVTVTGSLSSRGNAAPSEIVFTGSGIALDMPRGVVSELSGEIRATSPGPGGLTYGLSGDLFVQPGIVRSSLRQLALSAIDATSSAATPVNVRDLMRQIGLDIRLRTLDDLVADSNELKLSVAADVTVTGTLDTPGMTGGLTATDEGELFFGGRLYRVTSGRIEFVNPSSIDPRLNIVADTRVADYDVTMQLLGPPTDVTTRLTSDPPLSEGDLASLLATGRTLDERSNVTEEEAKAQLVSAVSSEYLGVIGRWFGLDTVRIERDPSDLTATDFDAVARLNVSKSFGRWLDVLYSQSLRSGDTAWVITYRTGWKRLDARATIQTNQSETVEVRQEVTFGGGAKPRPQRRRVETRPRVVDITFTGLDANDERDARGRMRMRVGKRFDVFAWRRDQERIAELFRRRDRQRVTVSSYRRDVGRPGEIAVDYVVDPGPVTTLAVTGATLSAKSMEAIREAWSTVGIDEFLVDEWREIATGDLVAQGFVAARVTPTITTPGNPWIQRDGHVAIDPGPQVSGREIAFEGNALVSDEQLRRVVDAAGLDPAGWVRPALLVAPIRERYAALGHLETTVRVDPIRVDGGRAILPVRIAEGRQFLVAALSISGERTVAEDAITSALGLETGAVYLPGLAERGADRVADLYRREAFPNALVSLTATVDPKTASADVHLTINEGARHVLAEMAVTGETITSSGLLRRVTDLTIGAPLANRTVDDAQSRLYDTGIFRSVTPTIEPLGDPVETGAQPVRVTFAVEEQPRYRLRYGLQASTNALARDGFTSRDVKPGATADLRRNNLFGHGFFAGAAASATTGSTRLRLLAGSTTWFGREADTIFSLEHRYAESSEQGFDVEARSLIASAEQRWPLTRHTHIAAGYAFESLSLTLSFLDPFSGVPLTSALTTELGSVSGTYTWDTRDNVFNPTRGWFHSSRVETGDRFLGSDLRYFKVLLQQYGFVQRRGVVFASAARFGAVNVGDETDLVSPEVRFRAGGATTVRGYRQHALTPVLFDGLVPGGNALLLLNQEVRVPVWGWLGGVAFVDAGNTFPGFRSVRFGDLAVGVGTGLRLNTPFGIIRLDLGFPVRESAPARRGIWYFGFGHAF